MMGLGCLNSSASRIWKGVCTNTPKPGEVPDMGWTRLRVLKALMNWHSFSGLGAKKTVKQTL